MQSATSISFKQRCKEWENRARFSEIRPKSLGKFTLEDKLLGGKFGLDFDNEYQTYKKLIVLGD